MAFAALWDPLATRYNLTTSVEPALAAASNSSPQHGMLEQLVVSNPVLLTGITRP